MSFSLTTAAVQTVYQRDDYDEVEIPVLSL